MSEQEIVAEVFANLRIDNPCPMLLARFQGQENGHYYCQSCEKEIVDFRGCSKEEITKQLTSPNICGIFYSNQLPAQSTVRYGFMKQMQFMGLAFLSFLGFNVSPLSAQSTNKLPKNPPAKSVYPSIFQEDKSSQENTIPLKQAKEKPATPATDKKEKKRSKRRRKKFNKRRYTMGCPSF